jgi:hypothetical protein
MALANGLKVVSKRAAIPSSPLGPVVFLVIRYQLLCQRLGSNSPIWLERCMGRCAITSRR